MPKYVPPTIKREGSGFTSAHAEVKVGDTKVQFRLKDDKNVYTVDKKNCPPYIKSGRFVITTDAEKSQITSMRPINGAFPVKVSKFIAPEGESPAPRTKEVKLEGKEGYSYQYFLVQLVITSGDAEGMEVLFMPRYTVSENTPCYLGIEMEIRGKRVEVAGHPASKSKHLKTLAEFEEVTGVWEKGALPYKENMLPLIEKRILDAGKEFMIVLKDGWIDTFYSTDPATESW